MESGKSGGVRGTREEGIRVRWGGAVLWLRKPAGWATEAWKMLRSRVPPSQRAAGSRRRVLSRRET